MATPVEFIITYRLATDLEMEAYRVAGDTVFFWQISAIVEEPYPREVRASGTGWSPGDCRSLAESAGRDLLRNLNREIRDKKQRAQFEENATTYRVVM